MEVTNLQPESLPRTVAEIRGLRDLGPRELCDRVHDHEREKPGGKVLCALKEDRHDAGTPPPFLSGRHVTLVLIRRFKVTGDSGPRWRQHATTPVEKHARGCFPLWYDLLPTGSVFVASIVM